jgi:hypothetical protein
MNPFFAPASRRQVPGSILAAIRQDARRPHLTLSLFPRYDDYGKDKGKNGVVPTLLIFPVTLEGDVFTDVAGRLGESSGALNDHRSIVRPGSDLGDHA